MAVSRMVQSAAVPTFVANAAITNLGQVSPGPTRVAEFRRVLGIRGAAVGGNKYHAAICALEYDIHAAANRLIDWYRCLRYRSHA